MSGMWESRTAVCFASEVGSGNRRHRQLPSRRLRKSTGAAAAVSRAYAKGRADAAGDVVAVAGTFESGIVWAGEAADAAMGRFDSRTVEGGLATWADSFSDDFKAALEDRLQSGESSLNHGGGAIRAMAESLASHVRVPRLDLYDSCANAVPLAPEPEGEDDDER